MKPSIASKLDQLSRRLAEINAFMSSEDATRDMDQYRRITREHAEIEPVVQLYSAYQRTASDISAAEEMLADPEMKSFAEAEIGGAEGEIECTDGGVSGN